MLHPIKCALRWAFWDQDAADEIAVLTTQTGYPELVTDSEFSTTSAAGPCVDLDAASICTSDVLGIEMPGAVVIFFTTLMAVMVVFEVVGLFARITGG